MQTKKVTEDTLYTLFYTVRYCIAGVIFLYFPLNLLKNFLKLQEKFLKYFLITKQILKKYKSSATFCKGTLINVKMSLKE